MSELWKETMLEALRTASQKLAHFLPNLLAMLSLLLLGLVAGLVLRGIVRRVLRGLRFDQLCERWGFGQSLLLTGMRRPASDLVGILTSWGVFLFFAMVALEALELPGTKSLIPLVIGFLPQTLAAFVILVAGIFLANFLGQAALIAAVNAQIPTARLAAQGVRWTIILFTLAMVLTQLGIGHSLILAAFSITFGGLILALAIAFGLGGRDLAREMIERHLKKDQPEEKEDEFRHL
ncbi:MAG: hypothetical protein HYV08_03540 [Deltaproteobacteria bacterium]|nr:hypothetical protein [Deltaproteobacteria bacterium]MBI3078604.1 hypothetical protein [Deltaproteobacteria bacterium]